MLGLTALRRSFFQKLEERLPPNSDVKPDCVVVTHVLPDRPEFLEALSRQAEVIAILAIPYSVDPGAATSVAERYRLIQPTLKEFADAAYLRDKVKKFYRQRPTIILDIGGYFATALPEIQRLMGDHFLGIVEDTESGHKRYEERPHLPVPVVSVARSTLKRSEDALVGASTFFSFERLVRRHGFVPQAKRILVLGYGKVGRNLAHVARREGNEVHVYDQDPATRILALSEGFLTPGREESIRSADVVFGATGARSLTVDDAKLLKKGAILVSSSSRKIEFPMEEFQGTFPGECSAVSVRRYSVTSASYFYVIHGGHPANFLDGGVIGPVLSLTHGEIVAAVSQLRNTKMRVGLGEVSHLMRMEIAQSWIEIFVDDRKGSIHWEV